ncbi:MAG TPA: integrin alpha, partial [Candidatus Sumerlaeota bacterium]|nr:integrin alpha [Candidatus Sumerlaeota bacterium]
AIIPGDLPGGNLGWSLSGAGFVDGDGISDFLVGAPGTLNQSGLGRVFLLYGNRNASIAKYTNFARTGMFGVNNISVAPVGNGVLDEGSHAESFSRTGFYFFGGRGALDTNPASRQTVTVNFSPPPDPLDADFFPAGVFWSLSTTRETDSISNAESIVTFKFLRQEIAGLDRSRLRVFKTMENPPLPSSCWVQVSDGPSADDTFSVHREHAAGEMKNDISGVYAIMQAEKTYELGEYIPPPCNVNMDELASAGPTIVRGAIHGIHLPTIGGGEGSVAFWHMGPKRLYAVAPCEEVTVIWKKSNGKEMARQLLRFVWPDEGKHQIYVAGTSEIDLTENNRYTAVEWRVMEDTLNTAPGDNIVSNHKFLFTRDQGHGRCFLMFTKGSNQAADPIFFLPVKVIRWNDPHYLLDHQPAVIGEEIMDESLHDKTLGSPFVYFWKNAYYNISPGYYTLGDDDAGPTREGPIFPVNENDLDLTDDPDEDDMVVAYYQKSKLFMDAYNQKIIDSEMGFPWKPVRYNPAWPGNPDEIIIASTNGTGDLVDMASPVIYFQNDPALPGYNPNEEHAIHLGGVIYALRTDLNILENSEDKKKSSLPYVLVNHNDTDTGDPKMRVYKVLVENEEFTLTYEGDAGHLIQSPMPLPILLPGANFCPNSGTATVPGGCYDATDRVVDDTNMRAVVYTDKNGQQWASAAGSGGQDALIVMRYFYPAEPGFAFPGYEETPDLGECIPWLDKWARENQGHADHITGTNVPANITYLIKWPED